MCTRAYILMCTRYPGYPEHAGIARSRVVVTSYWPGNLESELKVPKKIDFLTVLLVETRMVL